MTKKTYISDHIHESTPLENTTLLAVKTGIKNAVTIRGSLFGGRNFSPVSNPLIADLTVLMLNRGTTKHNKEEIRERLEQIGASIEFTVSGDRMRFEARCLKKNVPTVISLLAEQLRYSAFKAQQLSVIKQHILAKLLCYKENTHYRAEGEFLRTLYPRQHPHYRVTVDEALKYIIDIDRAHLKDFHKKNYGLDSLIITVAGDVSMQTLERSIQTSFAGWKTPTLARTLYKKTPKERNNKKIQKYISIPDKSSVDIYLGHPINLTKEHPDFYALLIAIEILGGRETGFTGRLMNTVREKKGLTYGVYASLSGVEDGNKGYWSVWGTFAPTLLKKGREEIEVQLKRFLQSGVTSKEVTRQKQSMIGSYTVFLSNTKNLSQTLLINKEERKPKSYIDTHRDKITKVTTKEVNNAIKKYMKWSAIAYVAAGSITKESKPH